MKNLKLNRYLLLIVLLAVIVRFYNFENRITFGPEQAISLLVSGDYINEKFSLLGLPSTQRTTSFGHIIYYPPIFNYSLIPFLIIFNYSVVLITGYFAFLNIATGLVLYIVSKKILNQKAALFSSALFLFNSYMINHSMFIWSVNYLPILNVLLVYLLFKMYKKISSRINIFIVGFLSSLSLGVEYIYIFTGVFILFLTIYFSKNKLTAFFLFLSGAATGILPTIIFDLTHDFYHLKSLWQYFLDTVSNPSQSNIAYYQFLQFWPILALLAGFLLFRIYKRNKILSIGILALYVFYNLMSPLVSFSDPVGMYKGLNYFKVNQAAELVTQDKPESFNVVMTFDFDSRAHPLRYLLKYNHNFSAGGVEDYPNSKNLYVFTTKDYPISKTGLWEVASFKAVKVQLLGEIGNNFVLYKLTKTN